jgi:hypothetical protein
VVVLPEPLVDDRLGLLCRRKRFGIKNLARKGPVEAFIVTVLPE